LDEFDIPTPKWKGCFGTNISMLIDEWKREWDYFLQLNYIFISFGL
jgi:hypothetical protein